MHSTFISNWHLLKKKRKTKTEFERDACGWMGNSLEMSLTNDWLLSLLSFSLFFCLYLSVPVHLSSFSFCARVCPHTHTHTHSVFSRLHTQYQQERPITGLQSRRLFSVQRSFLFYYLLDPQTHTHRTKTDQDTFCDVQVCNDPKWERRSLFPNFMPAFSNASSLPS